MKNIVKVRYINKKHTRFNHSSFKKITHNYPNKKCAHHRWPVYTSITVLNDVGGIRWWLDETKAWSDFESAQVKGVLGGGYSSHCSQWTNSVKAAIRHAKKHTELPVGTVLGLCSNLVGVGIEIRIVGKTR